MRHAKRITVTVDADMYDLLQERKARDGIPISTQVQRAIAIDILQRAADKRAPARAADQVTLEQCVDLPPIPGRQTDEEFIRGGRTLEEIEDALYGPRLTASKLVDTPAEYDAQAGE